MSKRIGPDEGPDPTSPEIILPGSRTSMVYNPGETLFGAVALAALKNGWTLIPQERGIRRISARVDGQALKWGKYVETPPTPEEVAHWSRQAPAANGAILMGKPSGLVFCFDIDVVNPELSIAIQDLATEKLGYTRFNRIGQKPKIALFYRVEREEDLPANRAYRFVNQTNDGISEDLLEIQARGKLVTAYGYHHKTDRYFEWEGPQPTTFRTDEVPVVTLDQIEEFILAVQDIRAFYRNPATAGYAMDLGEITGDLRQPKLRLSDHNCPWIVDAKGMVVDGREAYLWHLADRTVRTNAQAALLESNEPELRAMVIREFERTAEISGKWNTGFIRHEAYDKIGRAIRDLREGRSKPIDPTFSYPSAPAPASEHRFLLVTERKQEVSLKFSEIDDAEKEKRKLNLDRKEAGARIAGGIRIALSAAMHAVYEGRVEEVHVIPGPTGSGKTSQAIRLIAEDERTYCDDGKEADDQSRLGPWIFMLPTYNNVRELRRRAALLSLDPKLDDDDLIAEAAKLGVFLEGSEALQQARDTAVFARLRTMVYKGKVAAGCKMEDIVKPLQQAGIRTGGLCKTKKRDKMSGEMVLETCAHFATCPAMQQRADIRVAHVVFVVQNFLTLAIPAELKTVRGVILDERIFHLLLHGATLRFSSLLRGRRPPKLGKREIDAGMDPEDFVQDRDLAVELVMPELEAGRDPARFFAEHPEGERLVASARRVTGGAMAVDQAVFPNMKPKQVADLLARPTGVEVGEEYRFWTLIEERMKLIKGDNGATPKDATTLGLLKSTGLENEPRFEGMATTTRATGETDAGVRVLPGRGEIRLSWMDDMNWAHSPKILLDASLNFEITKRLFPNSNIIRHDVYTDLNMRVLYGCDMNWSVSSILPKDEDSPFQLMVKAGRLAMLRAFLSRVSAIYAHGCVVVSMPKKMRYIVQRDWVKPFNLDIRHHGAVKGLDFANKHVAVVAIGRLEPPARAIDSQVAALTRRDEVPEPPFDKFGTGRDDEDKPIFQARVDRTVRMRDKDGFLKVQEYGLPMARAIQDQYREEETRQILGRPRPIFRPDTVDAIVLGQALPSDIIVDQVTNFSAMYDYWEFWDLVRRCGGIIDLEAMVARSPEPISLKELMETFETMHDREEILKRYHQITSRTKSGKTVQWWIPGYISDRPDEVRDYATQCAPTDTIMAIKMSEMTVMPSDRAPVDDLDREIGDIDAQYAGEAAVLRPIIEMAVRRGALKLDKQNNLAYRLGEGDYESLRGTIGAWQIMSGFIADRKKKAAELAGEPAPLLEPAAIQVEAPAAEIVEQPQVEVLQPRISAGGSVLAPGEDDADWGDLLYG